MYNKIGKVGDYMEKNYNDYIKYAKEIIKLINKNGAVAYFVGQFCRNVLMNKPFSKIELFTTATNPNLLDIFSNYKISVFDEQNMKLSYMGYDYDLCTFKTNIQKENIKAVKRHYCSALMDYLERRDFVLNAIAINYSDRVIDVFDARKDIKSKKIKMIGEPKVRFNESPIRMLKAITFVSQYGFKLDKKILKAFKKRKKLLLKLSPTLIVLEMKQILEGPYFKKAVRTICETGLYKKMPLLKKEILRLARKPKRETIDEFVINCLIQNGEYNIDIARGADNEQFVKRVVNLALANPKSEFDDLTLYRNGLEICLASNKTNVINFKAKKKYKEIQANYEKLPIKKTCDLKFKGQDVLEITNDNGGPYLISLMEQIELNVILGVLNNDYNEIRDFVYGYLNKSKEPYQSNMFPNIDVSLEKTIEETEEKLYEEEEVDLEENSNVGEENRYNQAESNTVYVDYEKLENYSNETTTFEDEIRKIEEEELEGALNKEIDALIKKSQVLDGLSAIEAVDTYNRMKARYRDVFIEKYPKYSKLKEKKNEQ